MKERLKTVIALGYFDSVHIGHRMVLKVAKEIAKENGASFTVFTFSGNLRGEFSKDDYFIYDDKKRRNIYKTLGADDVCFAKPTKEFLSKSGKEFLDWLNNSYDIIAYVCGSDYKFGNKASCTVEYLIEYANNHGQKVKVCDIVTTGSEKISTTLIKSLLNKGETKLANELLGESYNVQGTVVKGRGDGKKLGFPTANLDTLGINVRLKQGVYSGIVNVNDKWYKCLINLGACPTFNQQTQTLEIHILGFCGDIYGKTLTVYFEQFIREIKKFSNYEDLVKQIEKDREKVNGK